MKTETTEFPMTDEQIRQWIDACNHEPARQTLRDYLALRKTDTTKTLINDLAEMLTEAQSGYILGCGEDMRWDERKQAVIAEAKAYVEQN